MHMSVCVQYTPVEPASVCVCGTLNDKPTAPTPVLALYLHGDGGNGGRVQRRVLRVFPVHQCVMGDRTVGLFWWAPRQMSRVRACQRARYKSTLGSMTMTAMCWSELTGGRGRGGGHLFGLCLQSSPRSPPTQDRAFGVLGSDSVLEVAKRLQDWAGVKKF